MAGEFSTGEERKKPADKKHADGVTRRSALLPIALAAGGLAAAAIMRHEFLGSDGNPLSHDEKTRRLTALNAAKDKAKELGVSITDEQLVEVVGTYVVELEKQQKAARQR